MTTSTHNKKGFALLIAVVVAGILLSISFTMFNITLKQVTLSTAGKNSQIALYMADTGVECALFYDLKITDTFGHAETSGDPPVQDLTVPTTTIIPNCNGAVATDYTQIAPVGGVVINGVNYPETVKTNFRINSTNYPTDPSCATIEVVQYVYTNGTVEAIGRRVSARGYNICTNLLDPQRLERGLETYY